MPHGHDKSLFTRDGRLKFDGYSHELTRYLTALCQEIESVRRFTESRCPKWDGTEMAGWGTYG